MYDTTCVGFHDCAMSFLAERETLSRGVALVVCGGFGNLVLQG